MSAADMLAESATRALARSVVYRFLAGVLAYPSADVDATLSGLVGTLEEAFSLAHPGSGGPEAVDLREMETGLRTGIRLGEYVGIFGHSVRGRIPLYETEYGNADEGMIPAREIADISGFYAAAGLRPQRGAHEREDHVALECEFLQVLTRKEAHAEESGDSGQAEAMREVSRTFLAGHLGRFGPGLFRRLAAEEGFYGAVGRLAETFLTAELRHAGLPVGGEELELRVPLLGPDDEFRCTPASEAGVPARQMEV